MWRRALDDKNEESVYTPGVDGQAHYTKYTKITQENMAFEKGDLIKIVRRQDKKTQVMAMGKIEGFRQSGHESEGRLKGFVEIQKLDGLKSFESEFALFCLTTCDFYILKTSEEKTAQEDIAKSIVTVAQVKCAHNIISVGRDIDVEIIFYNCFCKRVANHFRKMINLFCLQYPCPRSMLGATHLQLPSRNPGAMSCLSTDCMSGKT